MFVKVSRLNTEQNVHHKNQLELHASLVRYENACAENDGTAFGLFNERFHFSLLFIILAFVKMFNNGNHEAQNNTRCTESHVNSNNHFIPNYQTYPTDFCSSVDFSRSTPFTSKCLSKRSDFCINDLRLNTTVSLLDTCISLDAFTQQGRF